MHDILLLGNNLAVLVAALELAAKGQKVGLLLDGKAVGGHFGGVRLEDYEFDIGMVLFECAASVPQSVDLNSYLLGQRNDSARFVTLVADYLERYVTTVRVPTPQVVVGGRRHADFVVANRLDWFGSLSDPEAIVHELTEAPMRHELHASNKLSSPAYDSASYEQASLFNHGTTLHHACFRPLCEKILGVPPATILARYHRLGWLPLYYPQTLTKALSGEPNCLAEYPFWSAVGGFSGEFVSKMLSELKRSSVDIVDGVVTEFKRNPYASYSVGIQGRKYQSQRLVLGCTQERASQLLLQSAPPRLDGVSVGILLGVVHRDHLLQVASCLFVADSEFSIYRITDHDACAGLDNSEWHRISVEINPAYFSRLYPNMEAERQQAQIVAELVELNVIGEQAAFRVLRYMCADNVFPLPTAVAVRDAARFAALNDHPGLALTGSLLGIGVSSFNDQIVQGLRIAEQWG